MALVINTNVMSLNAQRNLTTSGNQLATSLQRLSSGLRINSAKDDAAGLAISDRMTAQINGLNQAVRNANDGISLAQTTEGALQEVTNNLQRIRELAVQAANATNSTSDLKALDQEVQQRIAEIERISAQTAFNNRKVLDGSFGNATFQVGANVGETIGIALSTNTKASAIGKLATTTGNVNVTNLISSGATAGNWTSATVTDFDYTGAGNDLSFTVDGYSVSSTANVTNIAGLVTAVQTSLNASAGSGVYTVSNSANQLVITKTATGSASTAPVISGGAGILGAGTGVAGAAYSLGAFSVQVGNAAAVDFAGAYDSASDFAAAINSQLSGVYASVDAATGYLSIRSAEPITITSGAGTTALGMGTGTTAVSGSLMSANVLSAGAANDAILRIDAALTSVSDLRGTLGAIQNRFQSTINSLQTVSENLTASRGRILDTDYAAETAQLTRAQILQQAGTAMVAQANSAPQSVLSLLQG
ncbi:MAG: B-type flagellin [Steroidobacteraceae bacterium]|nr:B-type flagellin [Steroidobacteraceae bacterium]